MAVHKSTTDTPETRTPSSATPEVSELVGELWYLHRRGLSYASDTPAVNLLLANLSEGIGKAATALETLEARVRVLEEALEKIADHKTEAPCKSAWEEDARTLVEVQTIARAALLKQLD